MRNEVSERFPSWFLSSFLTAFPMLFPRCALYLCGTGRDGGTHNGPFADSGWEMEYVHISP